MDVLSPVTSRCPGQAFSLEPCEQRSGFKVRTCCRGCSDSGPVLSLAGEPTQTACPPSCNW